MRDERGLMYEEIHGFKFIFHWMWEYILWMTSGKVVLYELGEIIAFPRGVMRLNQMRLIRDLTDLHRDEHLKLIDPKEELGYLECLQHSLVDDRQGHPQVKNWGLGFNQYSLDLKQLSQPILNLKEKILVLDQLHVLNVG